MQKHITNGKKETLEFLAREIEARVKELELRDGDATHMLMDMEIKNHEMSLRIADLERQLAEARGIIKETSDTIRDEVTDYDHGDDFRTYLEAIVRRAEEFMKKEDVRWRRN